MIKNNDYEVPEQTQQQLNEKINNVRSRVKSYKSASNYFGDLKPIHCEAMGGPDGVLKVTRGFYERVFKDPILSILFKIHEDAHPQRLAWALLFFMEIDQSYIRERGFQAMHYYHNKSKRYEERKNAPPGAGCPGKGFTISQRNAWKTHFMWAVKEIGGLKEGLLQDMDDWVERLMPIYGPFEKDRVDN